MCPTTYDYPLDQPLDPAIDLRLAGAYVQGCEKFYRDEGVDLRNFNTLENAEDLEDLRVHLGAEKITLWATSYGTHLAFAYLKLHPDRVHRVILHGIEGPDHTIKLPSDADTMLGEIARRAATDPALQKPDLIGDLRTILARVDAQPVRVTVTVDDEPTSVVLGGYDIRLHTADRLRSPWSSMALPAIVAEMKRGDFTRYARSAIDARRGQRYSLMTVLMDCASGISAARQERVERELASSLLGNVLNRSPESAGTCRPRTSASRSARCIRRMYRRCSSAAPLMDAHRPATPKMYFPSSPTTVTCTWKVPVTATTCFWPRRRSLLACRNSCAGGLSQPPGCRLLAPSIPWITTSSRRS
jgi:pimeloyl-ACP methyl ester carboxylesterase